MADYSDFRTVWLKLKEDQNAEHDLRKQIKKIIDFMHKDDGQWEPNILNLYRDRPRYTFDQSKPLVSKIWAEMAANEYTATTEPVGDGADNDVSDIYDGLLRSIYNNSSFDDISTRAGKRMIATGMGGWRVISKMEEYSFNQELSIIPITDFNERVWFDSSSELQTREDAMHVTVVSSVSKDECNRKWPDRGGQFVDVDQDIESDSYYYKPTNKVHVAEILYKKRRKVQIYLLDDGSVVDKAGLKKKGLPASSAVDSRETEVFRVYSRKYDGMGWLEGERETVFSMLPVIPNYANFDVVESKVTYEGAVRGIMDHGRVFNYVESRKVEESILSPRATVWMDERHAEGRTDELADLNRRPASVQLYKGGVDGAQLPYPTPGPQVNPALSELSNDMVRNIQLTTGMSNQVAEMESSKRDSDFRFDTRNSIGQMGTFEYYRGHKVALEHTARVIVDAVPRVIDSERAITTMDERGKASTVEVNKKDMATGEVINDLTAGRYKVTMSIGPTFESRQADANSKLLELGDRVPSVLENNTDIIASNIDAPGMKMVAERERAIKLNNNQIPESQWTDEEREQMAAQQAMQQEAAPDPAVQIAEAEIMKAQNEQQATQFRALEAQAKLELAQNKQAAEVTEKQMKLELDTLKAQMESQSQEFADLKTLAETMKTLVEATGATAVMGPQVAQSISNQAGLIVDEQNDL